MRALKKFASGLEFNKIGSNGAILAEDLEAAWALEIEAEVEVEVDIEEFEAEAEAEEREDIKEKVIVERDLITEMKKSNHRDIEEMREEQEVIDDRKMESK